MVLPIHLLVCVVDSVHVLLSRQLFEPAKHEDIQIDKSNIQIEHVGSIENGAYLQAGDDATLISAPIPHRMDW